MAGLRCKWLRGVGSDSSSSLSDPCLGCDRIASGLATSRTGDGISILYAFWIRCDRTYSRSYPIAPAVDGGFVLLL